MGTGELVQDGSEEQRAVHPGTLDASGTGGRGPGGSTTVG